MASFFKNMNLARAIILIAALGSIALFFVNRRDRDQLALGQGELTAAPLVAARACADAALLRALPSVLYAIIFYPLAGFAGFNRASPGGGGGLEHFAIFVAIALLAVDWNHLVVD